MIPPQPTESQSVMDEGEAPNETIPPVEEPVPDEEPVPEESNEPVAQSGEKILESETTTAYSYIYASGKLLQEKVTTNGKTETHNFFYDSTGKPYAMQVNGTTYYYVTNLQGDVMGMVDSAGNTVATYTYDPYGKPLTATGTLADKNPLRYRGYYYDSESSLYYLQSRYYDPATRRFINADSYASTGQGLIGHNMFAYCLNSPTMLADQEGLFARKEVFYIYCDLNERRPPRLSDYINQREPQAIKQEEQRIFRIVDHAIDSGADAIIGDVKNGTIKTVITGGRKTFDFVASRKVFSSYGGLVIPISIALGVEFAVGFVAGLVEGIKVEYVQGRKIQ